MDNMFETAARLKVRFGSPKGLLTVEDLFDLPLTSNTGRANLDDIAKELYRQLKDDSEIVSFVTPAKTSEHPAQLMFDIVKHIIGIRVAERDAAAQAAAKREQKQKLMALIADKENEALAGKSLDELRAMVEQL